MHKKKTRDDFFFKLKKEQKEWQKETAFYTKQQHFIPPPLFLFYFFFPSIIIFLWTLDSLRKVVLKATSRTLAWGGGTDSNGTECGQHFGENWREGIWPLSFCFSSEVRLWHSLHSTPTNPRSVANSMGCPGREYQNTQSLTKNAANTARGIRSPTLSGKNSFLVERAFFFRLLFLWREYIWFWGVTNCLGDCFKFLYHTGSHTLSSKVHLVCSVFSCIQNVAWLPVLGILNTEMFMLAITQKDCMKP